MTPMDQITARRAEYVATYEELAMQLQDSRKSLPDAERAYHAAQDSYDALTRCVLAPTRQHEKTQLTEVPSATHAWLTHDARAPLEMAASACRALQRKIKQLEEECAKWRGEIEFLDRVLSFDKVTRLRPVVEPPRKPAPIDFDDIMMPREGSFHG
ncbi:MAG TPA: hypothetical protein VHB68_09475 [Steroidobacteraceae bacterium]|nr:hypothetical protein [Steroidobacteraceae bacterium]